ncbi:MAG: hypothetical protein WAX85_00700 [Minisyncoccia bacterium]
MFELIEKIRQKSDRTKKRIAFLISFTIAGIIFVIWILIIFPDFRKKQEQESKATSYDKTPLSSLSSTFSNGLKSIGEQFQKIKESFSLLKSEPLHYNKGSSDKNIDLMQEATTTGVTNSSTE